MKRREFLKRAGILAGASAFSFLPKISFAAGKPVDEMTLLTANASFDPVRPEMGRFHGSKGACHERFAESPREELDEAPEDP